LADVSLAQNHCTAVTNLTAIPFGTNTCGSNYFTIRGTEVRGSHPVTVNIGSTANELKGVCAYTYSGCVANQYFPFTAQSPAVTGYESVTVNAQTGAISITVIESQPQLTPNSRPCNCYDANPQGYNNVQQGPAILLNEVVHGQC
jgi:hypothetical protein